MFARRQKADLWKGLVIKIIMERRRGLQWANLMEVESGSGSLDLKNMGKNKSTFRTTLGITTTTKAVRGFHASSDPTSRRDRFGGGGAGQQVR